MDNIKKLVVGAAFAAVSSTCAFAADLPMQAYKSAPVVAQPTVGHENSGYSPSRGR